RVDVQTYDLVGQGCAAAVPNWRMAEALVAAGRARHVVSIWVEGCTAAMDLDNDTGVLVCACLFSDGAGGAVLSATLLRSNRCIEWKEAGSLTIPAQRESLRFEQRAGLLRNVLTGRVPALAAKEAQHLIDAVLTPLDLGSADIQTWIWHAGGRDVLLAL